MKGQQRGPLNISSGVGYSLNQIINMIEKYKGEEVEVVYQSKRSFDIPEVILDNQLAKSTLGWVPLTSIEHGLSLTLQHGLK
jgi:UDP-glucose 4-epimerase